MLYVIIANINQIHIAINDMVITVINNVTQKNNNTNITGQINHTIIVKNLFIENMLFNKSTKLYPKNVYIIAATTQNNIDPIIPIITSFLLLFYLQAYHHTVRSNCL